jgi:undecaprenyl diphosphate synthase
MGREESDKLPRHLAIIPDGNGRWAEARGLPREEGHRRGTEVVREVVRSCHELGIGTLTLYAFSQENWGRPRREVHSLMTLLEHYLRSEADELMQHHVRVQSIGRLDGVPQETREALCELEGRTQGNDELCLVFALSYSGRTEIVDAVRSIARGVAAGQLEPDSIDEKTVASHLYAPELPDPDLLIRSGAEHRVSNFLLWQLAYSEICVTDRLWPDFTRDDLLAALDWYARRERRRGRTGAQVRSTP